MKALHHSGKENGYDFKILESVFEVNESQKLRMFQEVKDYFKGDLKGKTFAIWGLAFKPDTDDIREAPALEIITNLLAEGATVKAYDPEAMPNVSKVFGDKIAMGENQYDILEDADALLICTEWSVFRTPEFEKMDATLKNKLIWDGRNLYDLDSIKERGYRYSSIGRETVNP